MNGVNEAHYALDPELPSSLLPTPATQAIPGIQLLGYAILNYYCKWSDVQPSTLGLLTINS